MGHHGMIASNLHPAPQYNNMSRMPCGHAWEDHRRLSSVASTRGPLSDSMPSTRTPTPGADFQHVMMASSDSISDVHSESSVISKGFSTVPASLPAAADHASVDLYHGQPVQAQTTDELIRARDPVCFYLPTTLDEPITGTLRRTQSLKNTKSALREALVESELPDMSPVSQHRHSIATSVLPGTVSGHKVGPVIPSQISDAATIDHSQSLLKQQQALLARLQAQQQQQTKQDALRQAYESSLSNLLLSSLYQAQQQQLQNNLYQQALLDLQSTQHIGLSQQQLQLLLSQAVHPHGQMPLHAAPLQSILATGGLLQPSQLLQPQANLQSLFHQSQTSPQAYAYQLSQQQQHIAGAPLQQPKPVLGAMPGTVAQPTLPQQLQIQPTQQHYVPPQQACSMAPALPLAGQTPLATRLPLAPGPIPGIQPAAIVSTTNIVTGPTPTGPSN